MSDIMFGERYFVTRGRLSELMGGIAKLASESGTDVREILPFSEMEKGFGSPVLFIVCGEVNAGKSTFLNALFGTDLCRASSLPETDKVTYYRYGNAPREVDVTPLLTERYRPVEFLQNFNLIDTPGTNSAVQDHQEITGQFFPAADLTFFVFPIANPWEAATWNFISRMPSKAMERIAFIIQQADQREPADIAVTLGHVAELSKKRIGRVPPIFAVSGKSALLAKQSAPLDRNLLIKSGYPALEHFISKSICESDHRKQVLERWISQASVALRAVEDQIENQTRTLNQQEGFLESIEREIDEIRERFVTRLPRHLASVAQVFQTEAVWVSRTLRKNLGTTRSVFRLFVGDRTGPMIEATFIERLQSAVEIVAEKDGTEAVEACHEHWRSLVDRVRDSMQVQLGEAAPLDNTLVAARDLFVQRLGMAARDGIGNLKVRNQLDKELRRRNLALRSFTFMTLSLLAIAGISGSLSVPWVPYILSGLAAAFSTGGVITAITTRKSITADFQKRLLNTCGGFASALRSDYEDALRVAFQDYLTSLTPVRNHLAREKSAVEPKSKRWQELFLTLKAIEQDL